MFKKYLLVTAIALIAPAAFAATPIKAVAKPIDARGTVEIGNIRGAVKITGWTRNMVAVTGSLGADTKLVFEGSGSRLVVRAERIDEDKGWLGWNRGGPSEDTLLQVHVPSSASLEIESVSADVDVSGIEGAALIKLESVSGDAILRADSERLDISSVSGDVDFVGHARRAHGESVSGDVDIRGIEGELSVETVSGDVEIGDSNLRQLDAGSVSGDMEFDVGLIGNANVSVESMSGEVTLNLPENLSATVHGETFSGSLKSDFPLQITDESGPGSKMQGKLGSGDARIRLETFSGDIHLRKR